MRTYDPGRFQPLSSSNKQTPDEHLVVTNERRLAGSEQWLAWNEQLASRVGVSGMTN
jgi:hypothetical protein